MYLVNIIKRRLEQLYQYWIKQTSCAHVHAKSLQSCPTFCDPMDCTPSGSSVHGDSPGKNTGVGCHFRLQNRLHRKRNYQGQEGMCVCVCVCVCVHVRAHVQSCLTFCDPMDCRPPGSSVHEIFQARILVGCHFLLQGIFLTQGSNLCFLPLLHWQADSLPLYHLRSPQKGILPINK